MYAPQLIKPSATEPDYTRSVSHIAECQHTSADVPHTNQTKSYRALLHQVSITYCRMPTYPGQMYPPANWTRCYRALIHKISITYCRMLTYPRQMYPPIKPSSTEPYDTRSVWYVEECQHTRADVPLQSNLILQNPMTTGQFDMLKNADIPRADIPTPANLVLQSPMTPGQFHIWKNTDVPDQ